MCAPSRAYHSPTTDHHNRDNGDRNCGTTWHNDSHHDHNTTRCNDRDHNTTHGATPWHHVVQYGTTPVAPCSVMPMTPHVVQCPQYYTQCNACNTTRGATPTTPPAVRRPQHHMVQHP